ncbi:SRR1 family protein [Aspergillus saccharolyticus JOP 1030-1]|uniref:SRR1-like domain-containing protein n=1 Tax=Aspergillus saccharolyticus JOP 1030-1 TaxID=1450539 RepID=A0A318ZN42_9EURO|nr:hypothetical protein BP01DRAFT_288493 [Aspergillus saccharolyticus JOP 1030-1]PYH48936.1 hypothetical protein BP01DRAFT_288493 [Aspergillus saccharolyticus JOP 1030-1]
MPHTSRKKKATGATKRTTITDSTGWTHVTTTGHAHRAPNPRRRQQPAQEEGQEEETLLPAEAPKSLTLPDLLAQYHTHRVKWSASATAATLTATIRRHVHHDSSSQSNPNPNPNTTHPITNIICIGLGSPSGFLRGGWVDRRSVSLYQLNALMSVVESDIPTPTPTLPVYAQDPVFNSLDHDLLTSFGITVVNHPDGFEKVTPGSLLFCPGAEKTHLELLLARNPACVVGGPLEDTGSEHIDRYVAGVRSMRLPRFEEMKEAFWEQRVYYTTREIEDRDEK